MHQANEAGNVVRLFDGNIAAWLEIPDMTCSLKHLAMWAVTHTA